MPSPADDFDKYKTQTGEDEWAKYKVTPSVPAAPPKLEGATSRLQTAVNTGQTPAQPVTQFEKERTPEGSALWRGTKALGKGLGGIASGIMDTATSPFDPTAPARMAGQISTEDMLRKLEGRSKPYRALAAGGSLIGLNPRGQEEAAEHADSASIVGQAAAPVVAMAAAPLAGRALEAGGELAGRGLTAAGDAAAGKMRWPATARQSQLGRPGTVKNILPSFLQRYTIPEGLVPKGSVGTPTNAGPFMEIPAKMPRTSTRGGITNPIGNETPFSGGRSVILPGEEIDPMRTKSAGSAAQATEADLQRLAEAGDKSAASELVRRRLLRRGEPRNYGNFPLPRR